MSKVHWFNPQMNMPPNELIVLVKTIMDDVGLGQWIKDKSVWHIQPYKTAWYSVPTSAIVGWRYLLDRLYPLEMVDDR